MPLLTLFDTGPSRHFLFNGSNVGRKVGPGHRTGKAKQREPQKEHSAPWIATPEMHS